MSAEDEDSFVISRHPIRVSIGKKTNKTTLPTFITIKSETKDYNYICYITLLLLPKHLVHMQQNQNLCRKKTNERKQPYQHLLQLKVKTKDYNCTHYIPLLLLPKRERVHMRQNNDGALDRRGGE